MALKVSGTQIDLYVDLLVSFFSKLTTQYGFGFSMAEVQEAIKGVQDPLDVEDVLYTTEAALCHTKEECDVFQTVFCQHFLKYEVRKNENPSKKENKLKLGTSLAEMTEEQLARKRAKAENDRAEAERAIKRIQDRNSEGKAAGKLKDQLNSLRNVLNKKIEKAEKAKQAYEAERAAAIKEASSKGLEAGTKRVEELIQKINTSTNETFEKSGFADKVRKTVAGGTKKEVDDLQKLLMRGAMSARRDKNIPLYADFASLAKEIQTLGKKESGREEKAVKSETVQASKAMMDSAMKDMAASQSAVDIAETKWNAFQRENRNSKYEIEANQRRIDAINQSIERIDKAQKAKQADLIIKGNAVHHRELYTGGHNAVRTKGETDRLLNQSVASLSKEDTEKIVSYIRTNAKIFRQKLRKLYMTQQKRQIDVKTTIEKSVRCDGEIARLYYKKPIKSKANVIMLADISGSCRTITSLALTYMGLMREVFPGGCHQFVFVDQLVPVDHYFETNGVREAVSAINGNVPSRGIYSDYGTPIKQLYHDYAGIINKNTTVIILGDCRNNRNDPALAELDWLAKRVSSIYVLNPDDQIKWGQGDSTTNLYTDCGAEILHVSTTRELLDFLQNAKVTGRG